MCIGMYLLEFCRLMPRPLCAVVHSCLQQRWCSIWQTADCSTMYSSGREMAPHTLYLGCMQPDMVFQRARYSTKQRYASSQMLLYPQLHPQKSTMIGFFSNGKRILHCTCKSSHGEGTIWSPLSGSVGLMTDLEWENSVTLLLECSGLPPKKGTKKGSNSEAWETSQWISVTRGKLQLSSWLVPLDKGHEITGTHRAEPSCDSEAPGGGPTNSSPGPWRSRCCGAPRTPPAWLEPALSHWKGTLDLVMRSLVSATETSHLGSQKYPETILWSRHWSTCSTRAAFASDGLNEAKQEERVFVVCAMHRATHRSIDVDIRHDHGVGIRRKGPAPKARPLKDIDWTKRGYYQLIWTSALCRVSKSLTLQAHSAVEIGSVVLPATDPHIVSLSLTSCCLLASVIKRLECALNNSKRKVDCALQSPAQQVAGLYGLLCHPQYLQETSHWPITLTREPSQHGRASCGNKTASSCDT